ncbi:hypothetical protein ACFO4E_07255 [Nocardiopsis mangrovi]|uniref:Uncharacterized protein n=1 Tax=Nocardiopsis mangrovi TaxID=1179818 RepID=A0ABV9DUV0_9ACTN
MKLYADRRPRFLAQLAADASAVVWTIGWVWAALGLYDLIASLARPGDLLDEAGEGLSTHMADAAEQARGLPLAGDALAAPLDSVGGAGASLSEAGRDFGAGVTELALTLSLLTAVLPVLVVLAVWLPARAGFVRRATDAVRLRALPADAGARLLALRALSTAPAGRLAALHSDPVAAWQADDPAIVRGLAELELSGMGLHPHRR